MGFHSGFKGLTMIIKKKHFLSTCPGGSGGRRVGLTTLPPSCADCIEILGSLKLLES